MDREFDRGYDRQPYRRLVSTLPGRSRGHSLDSFRVEWGPCFIGGVSDGCRWLLIIGQDPATHEAIVHGSWSARPANVPRACSTRLGIDRSYVFINTFLYSVYSATVAAEAGTSTTQRSPLTGSHGSTPSWLISTSRPSSPLDSLPIPRTSSGGRRRGVRRARRPTRRSATRRIPSQRVVRVRSARLKHSPSCANPGTRC